MPMTVAAVICACSDHVPTKLASGSDPGKSEGAIHYTVIETATEAMPRCDTASVAELSDGRLMVVYHKFDASIQDDGPARIWSKMSSDGGKTWGKPRMLVDVAPGDVSVMMPALLKLASGDLLLTCSRIHAPFGTSSTQLLLRSSDDGKTFVEQPPIWKRSPELWEQGGASSLVQLRSGRLVLPFHRATDNVRKIWSTCYLSDDEGKTWRMSKSEIRLPRRGAMEPSVAELKDGTLVMSLRTQLGGPYLSISTDAGETWSPAEFIGLEGGESCTCLRRIPGSDDLLLLWNNSKYTPGHHHYGERNPLTAAISSDGGKTWRIVSNIVSGPDDHYTNLDCFFTSKDKAIITHMFARPAWTGKRVNLHAAIIDMSWFYQE